MLTRLRIRVPDRPGTLGRAAAALGTAGIDIHQVHAVERAGGRAILDLVVALPTAMLPGVVARMLSGIPGVRVEGCWQTTDALESDSDMEIIGEVVAAPGRAFQTLVDAAPRALHAHWAVMLSVPDGRPAYASWRAPRVTPPDLRSVRPRAVNAPDGSRVALAPLGSEYAVLVGRRNAPPFHPREVHRLAALAGTVAALRTAADHDRPAAASAS